MNWQAGLFAAIGAAAPFGAAVTLRGSATDPALLDGWSDLDLGIELPSDVEITDLVGVQVWAVEDVRDHDGQTCRTVLTDGRRLDLSVTGPGRVVGFGLAADNDVRFLAATATAKLGRGDRLIGLHLLLELWQHSLVQAMQLRDRDTGSTVHRLGSEHDQLADRIGQLATMALDLQDRPTVVERTVELYAAWRSELDADYRPDWQPLHRLTDLGLIDLGLTERGLTERESSDR